MKKLALFSLFVTLLLSSCWYNRKWEDLHPVPGPGPNGCSDTASITMSYSVHIAPLIQTNCSTNLIGCHKPGGFGGDLTTYAAVSGWCTGSPPTILCDIQHACNPMPKGASKLPDCEIAKVAKWIANGYPNN